MDRLTLHDSTILERVKNQTNFRGALSSEKTIVLDAVARTNARTNERTRDVVETVRAKSRVECVGVDVRVGDGMGGDAPGSF